MEVTKKTLLKALRSSKKVYGYVAYSANDGGYMQLIKSEFLKLVSDMPEDTDYSNVSINDKSIYIN